MNDEQLDGRVLVLAPTARDATISQSLLTAVGIPHFRCNTIEDICREAGRGAGAAVLTTEVVLGDTRGGLSDWLKVQPPWSDFPLIVLTPPGAELPGLLRALEGIGPMTLMKRPVQVSTFVSTVRSALRDRQRQYAVRDLLAERQQAADTLRLERERYRLTLSSIGDAVISTDADGRVTFMNGVAESLTGWFQPGFVGKPLPEVFQIVNEHTRQPVENPALRALRDGTVVGLANHTVLIARDGAERAIDDSAAPIRDSAGAKVGAVLVFRDVTERKRIEEELKAADRKKDDFLALLAHELRNPLAPIRNGLQVLRLAADANAVFQARSMMERQLTHMVRLVDDLLDVSRISRNKMELRRTRVSLADVVTSAIETARPVIDGEGHELNVLLPQRPVFLEADLTRLAQVFSNLLTNSAKYTGHGGHIWLAAERRGSEVVVSVRDTGIGIPTESLGNIFDMFSQVDRSIERSTGGLGIGLALVKGLVEMHGGSVSAQSPGSGQGSTFTVTLPVMVDQPVGKDTSTDGGQHVTRSKRRILVVDDNRDGANSLALVLRLLGDEVHTAQDGIEAVQQAEVFRPDVILMDVGMPRLNGLDATRRIREQTWGKAITIIALTGWGQEGDRERSREAGCNGHLVKPVNLPDVERMLSEMR